MAQSAYPTNPYMSLYLAMAYVIEGNQKMADEHIQKAVTHHQTDYWTERFAAFGLLDDLQNFPTSSEEVYQTMERLQELTTSEGRKT